MSDSPSLPILIEEPVTGPVHHSAAFPHLPSIITGRCRSRAAGVMQFRTQASPDAARRFFKAHLTEAANALGEDGDGHADDDVVPPPEIEFDPDLPSALLIALFGAIAASLPWIWGLGAHDGIGPFVAGVILLLLGAGAVAHRWLIIFAAASEWIAAAAIVLGVCLIVEQSVSPIRVAGTSIFPILGLLVILVGLWRLMRAERPYLRVAGVGHLSIMAPLWDMTSPSPDPRTRVFNFAAIRKSEARDAINAISLARVVHALVARGIPISKNRGQRRIAVRVNLTAAAPPWPLQAGPSAEARPAGRALRRSAA